MLESQNTFIDKEWSLLYQKTMNQFRKSISGLFRQNQECLVIDQQGKFNSEKIMLAIRMSSQKEWNYEKKDILLKKTQNIVENIEYIFNQPSENTFLVDELNLLLDKENSDYFTYSIIKNTLISTIFTMFCLPRLITFYVGFKNQFLRDISYTRIKSMVHFMNIAHFPEKYGMCKFLLRECDFFATHILYSASHFIRILYYQKIVQLSIENDIIFAWTTFLKILTRSLIEKPKIDQVIPWLTDKQKILNKFALYLAFENIKYLEKKESDLQKREENTQFKKHLEESIKNQEKLFSS